MNAAKKTLTWVPLLLIVTLLPLVAVLQYRWQGTLSELEQQRMERNLRTSTDHFSDEFDRELTRVYRTFHLDNGSGVDEIHQEFLDEYDDWQEESSVPALIDTVYWISGSARQELTLTRFDPLARQFEEAEWPVWLGDLRGGIAHDLNEYRNDRRGRQRQSLDPLFPGIPAVLILQDDVRPGGFVAVTLNRDLLFNELMPGWVRQYFSIDDQLEYDVLIVDRNDPANTIYRSSERVHAGELDGADDENVMFAFHNDALPMGEDHRWRVLVRHRAGSLEAAVTAARLRNLAISIGALVLLAGSMILLQLSARRAEALATQQMDFVAGVSHELRTPLAGISALSQNLADGIVDEAEKTREYGRTIYRESGRLRGMVETVLLFSKVRSGAARYDRRSIELADVIDDVISANDAPGLDAASPIDVLIDDDLPPIHADAGALAAAIRNVVINAVKFGDSASPIVIAARATPAGEVAEFVEITVTDGGAGIPADELPHVFDPFYRGTTAREAQIEGSGLGLGIVREVIDGHGGTVTIDSVVGEGTTVTILLPAAASPSTELD